MVSNSSLVVLPNKIKKVLLFLKWTILRCPHHKKYVDPQFEEELKRLSVRLDVYKYLCFNQMKEFLNLFSSIFNLLYNYNYMHEYYKRSVCESNKIDGQPKLIEMLHI